MDRQDGRALGLSGAAGLARQPTSSPFGQWQRTEGAERGGRDGQLSHLPSLPPLSDSTAAEAFLGPVVILTPS